MIVSFTGHRPQKIGGFDVPNPTYNGIVAQIKKTLIELQPEKAISGMALGVDQWAAEICIELKIPFIAAVPFEGQEKIWPQTSQDRYNALLQKAEEIVYVSEPGYAASKMQRRNVWMVDNSDTLIAVYDGSGGGTGNCVKYAESISKKIVLINPRSLMDKAHDS